MNKIEVQVDKIRSYQTLVYKNGARTFPKTEYKEYRRIISLQLGKLKAMDRSSKLSVSLHFKCKNKTVGDLDNITKPILDILQLTGKINNDRNVLELNTKKTFGHENNSIEIELKEVKNE